MADASPPPVRHDDTQRDSCPPHSGSYRCGNFGGCCAADPCDFLGSKDPCDAAVAALNGQGDDGGDDGNDDGGGGDDQFSTTPAHTSTPTSHTSTTAAPSSSTKNTKTTSTADNQTSSTPETPHTSTSANLPSTSQVEAPTTTVDGTTFVTSISNTSPDDGGATETTLPAPPAPTPGEGKNANNDAAAPLSNTTIAGVSVGGVVGGLALLLFLFWLLRRRRLSKRMSSIRGDSPTRHPKKSIMDRRDSLTGTALGTHSFSGIGGQTTNQNHHINYTYTDQPIRNPADTRQNEGWPLCTPSDLSVHQEQFNAPSSQRNLQPTCTELGSTEAQLGPAGPVSLGTRSPNRRPSPHIHPSPLTPGFPGTQMAIQNQSHSGSQRADSGIGQGYHDASSGNAWEEMPPRATLNATDHERLNNLYANSWARGL